MKLIGHHFLFWFQPFEFCVWGGCVNIYGTKMQLQFPRFINLEQAYRLNLLSSACFPIMMKKQEQQRCFTAAEGDLPRKREIVSYEANPAWDSVYETFES